MNQIETALYGNEADDHIGSFSNGLAHRWSEFVGWERRAQTMIPFLLRIANMKPDTRVLDLAAGIGCEVIELSRLGFDVVANEIQPEMRDQAQDKAGPHRELIRWTSVDWLDLQTAFGDECFDLILLLGNSFCLLKDRRERELVAKNIASICARGGKLVVDERNFGFILNHADEILNGKFRYKGEVIYCGKSIAGKPVDINESNVRFAYSDIVTGDLLGTLDMWPFRTDEISNTFSAAGLTLESVFHDLRPPNCRVPDFITYVFRKP